MTTTNLAEAFAQQAYTMIGNRDREIMRDPYLLGFEIVEHNEDNTRLVGVFAFRINREIVMAPVFYLNGQTKGFDLLYRKGVNLFTLNNEKWVKYLLSQDEDVPGQGVPRNSGNNRARMTMGLSDIYHNPMGGYKRASVQGVDWGCSSGDRTVTYSVKPGAEDRSADFDALCKMAGIGEDADKVAGVLGRYLASGASYDAILNNKQRIMEEIDPDRKYQEGNLIMNDEMIRKQREKAYDLARPTMDRGYAGGYLPNAALGGVMGAALGGGFAAANNADLDEGLTAAGISGAAGALLGVLHRAWAKHKRDLVSDKDIAAMKQQQKDRGLASELVPGRDIYDAIAAHKYAYANDGASSGAVPTAIQTWWKEASEGLTESLSKEIPMLLRQVLVDGDLGKEAAELVERIPEIGDFIVLAGSMDAPVKQASLQEVINSPAYKAASTEEKWALLRPFGPLGVTDLGAFGNGAQGPPDKQAGTLTWHAEPEAGWPEEKVAEFYKRGFLIEDKRAAAQKATAFTTDGMESRMATAHSTGVLRVMDRSGDAHKVLFGPRRQFYTLAETSRSYPEPIGGPRHEMLFLEGPHKGTCYEVDPQDPGTSPLVAEQDGDEPKLDLPKGEEPKAGQRYALWSDTLSCFVGPSGFDVRELEKDGDAVRLNAKSYGFAILRRDIEESDFSEQGNHILGADIRFIPVGKVEKGSGDEPCCIPESEHGRTGFVPLRVQDVMFGGRKRKTAKVKLTKRANGLSDILVDGRRVCEDLTSRQVALKLARDFRLPVDDATEAYDIQPGGTMEFTWVAPMRKQGSDEEAELLKLANFFFDNELDHDSDFDEEDYDDDFGTVVRAPYIGRESYVTRDVSPSPERNYLDAKDPQVRNPRHGKTMVNIPDEVIMQMANPGMELAQLGQQLGMTSLLDHGAVASMCKVFDAKTFISQYVDRMEQSLDALGRVLFLLYWKPRDFSELFGDDDLSILENKITGVFQAYGDLVLELLQNVGGKMR